MNLEHFNLQEFLVSMCALIICITIHEFAHAFTAWKAGDLTPKLQGRISLNPLDHLDPIGTIMMVLSSLSGFGIGWGKPVMVNPGNFRNPRWDNLKVSIWGPMSNLLTAAVFGLSLRFFHQYMNQNVLMFLNEIVIISLCLCFFNLIPVAPLDGSKVMSSLLPYEHARKYDMFMAQFGFFLFLGLIFTHVLSYILGPPIGLFYSILVGV